MPYRTMNKNRSLQNMLRDHTITADQFLQTQGISAQIRSNLSRFVDYCRTHRPFAIRMLQLAFNISYAELEDPSVRSASFAANEIFGNEETEVAELFFQPPPSEEKETKKSNDEIIEGIQSEAERLFRFDSEEEDTLPPEQTRSVEITGEELATFSLEILKSPQVNETCLGHLQKMYSFFIRHQPIPVLGYFQKHPESLELLLSNIRHSSVSSLVAQLLTSEDKKKQYKYQSLKRRILERVIQEIFDKMEDQCFFDGALAFLDEILSSTKQSYYQYFEDFKRIANYLVSQFVLKRFYDELWKLNEATFCSTSRFLQNLFVRINNEAEDSRYYHKEDDNQQTMDFQLGIFFNNIPALLSLPSKIVNFSSLTKIHYLSFLDALLNTNQAKQFPPSLKDPSFMALLDAYRLQPSAGMCKNKIYTLINGIISRSSEADTKTFLQEHPEIYEQYFTILKAANYSNTRVYNKNEGSAFDVSLIAKLTRKEEGALQAATKVVGKDMKRICKKYDTKIASFQNSNSFSVQEESDFHQQNNERPKSSETNLGFNLNFVGKNHISIPVLHLPDKFSNLEKKDKDLSPEMPLEQLSDSPKEIVEVEQVVSLTNKLQAFEKENKINIPTATGKEAPEGPIIQNEAKLPKDSEIPKQEGSPKGEEDDKVKKTNKKVEVLQEAQKRRHQQALQEQGKEVSVKEGVAAKQRGDSEKARFFTRHLAIFC